MPVFITNLSSEIVVTTTQGFVMPSLSEGQVCRASSLEMSISVVPVSSDERCVRYDATTLAKTAASVAYCDERETT